MSLINDALKRAEADKPRQAHSSAPVPTLQPVDSKPAPGASPVLLGGVILLGIGTIGIAGALWFRGRPVPEQKPTAQLATPAVPTKEAGLPTASTPREEIPAAAAELKSPEQTTSIPKQNKPVVAASESVSVPANNVAVASTNPINIPALSQQQSTPVASAPVPAKSTRPAVSATTDTSKPVRLQSIFYRLRSPTVIINGKTLGVGDSVDGIRVVSIQRTSVEIVQDGKYRTLTLQD